MDLMNGVKRLLNSMKKKMENFHFHEWELVQTGSYSRDYLDKKYEVPIYNLRFCKVCGKMQKWDACWDSASWQTLNSQERDIVFEKEMVEPQEHWNYGRSKARS